MESRSNTVPWPSDRQTQAELLAAEMVRRWQKGERPTACEYLDQHPELCRDKQAALVLVYEEYCLREEHAEPSTFADVLTRFPDWGKEFEVLVECHRLVKPMADAVEPSDDKAPPDDYVVLDELGRGSQGVVYLATQGSLANRPVVLKVTSRAAEEHLVLARLQHTSIVPLYAVHDDPATNTRTLCMPYFGGATLRQLLDLLSGKPVAVRTGLDLVRALDQTQETALLTPTSQGRTRAELASMSYELAICWMGRRLAEALQYAHERGLVHLDVKPTNVLFTADVEPMLLDFHSAQAPILPGKPAPDWLGGTPLYMSPEQQRALSDLKVGDPIADTVDGRSDVYSLGLVLYESLGGRLLGTDGEASAPQPARLPIAAGLRDILTRCLDSEPQARYATAGLLADDLRRHLNDLPLRGVRNRSLFERWRKWRRRRPFTLPLLVMSLGIAAALLSLALVYVQNLRHARTEAEAALRRGRDQFEHKLYGEAAATFKLGLQRVQHLHADPLGKALQHETARAERAALLDGLHRHAEQLRFLAGATRLSPRLRDTLTKNWETLWRERERLLSSHAASLPVELEERGKIDWLDAGLIWVDLNVRMAPAPERPAATTEALALLDELQAKFGHSTVLGLQRRLLREADMVWSAGLSRLLSPEGGAPIHAARTAWESWAIGRLLMQHDRIEQAAEFFTRAAAAQPDAFWPNFYLGLCTFRLQEFDRACEAFRVCIALAPKSAECHANLGRAEAARGNSEQALQALSRSLDLNPHLAAAALSRGLVHYSRMDHASALADLKRALADGAEPATCHYNLALVYIAQDDRDAAKAAVARALQADPQHEQARGLQMKLLAADRLPNP